MKLGMCSIPRGNARTGIVRKPRYNFVGGHCSDNNWYHECINVLVQFVTAL